MENLEVRYGAFSALKQITAEVKGGAVGLLGPNGSGKSTMIKALLGLLRFHEGKGSVLGLDVSRNGIEIRRRVGYMPERDCYIPGMTGFEHVAFCGRLSGMPTRDARRRAHEVLDYVDMGEARYRPVDGYSAGMRQRIKLAQALVHDPDFIILDEPTNGFDPKGRDEVLKLIYDVSHNKEMHLLLSSHLLQDVERTCDSVLLLRDGMLLKHGMIKELKQREDRAVELEIKGSIPDFTQVLHQRGWSLDRKDKNRWWLHMPADTETRDIFESAMEAGVQLRAVIPSEESLEELFMKSIEE